MLGGKEEERIHNRLPLKPHVSFNNYYSWKEKLREKCFKRVREDRNRLLWKLRLSNNMDQSIHSQDIKSTFRDIVSDELKSIKSSSIDSNFDELPTIPADGDAIWEYNGLPIADEGDCEDILLEMQKIFYEELRLEEGRKESEIMSWDDEEDEYLAREVLKHMQLQDEQGQNDVWCPICKHGVLQEHCRLIFCNLCQLKIDRADEVNLEFLRSRLAEAHADHLDRGCKLRPGFCIESRFGLTALYIKCEDCRTFEVVI
ncbi:OLC1v1006532C1 [Oldenlandia corymbosa var. corymbosa]|uniref:OLC1v1006532C1 n=1 Tax=Oldenlandia corymbosa var. corymbosa TaxID=529605 RepID=A0AAV1DIQ1_OLDCO|nr:OLC1v1006532C1 [Oldenlandia corymbosa var. corymbosa]